MVRLRETSQLKVLVFMIDLEHDLCIFSDTDGGVRGVVGFI